MVLPLGTGTLPVGVSSKTDLDTLESPMLSDDVGIPVLGTVTFDELLGRVTVTVFVKVKFCPGMVTVLVKLVPVMMETVPLPLLVDGSVSVSTLAAGEVTGAVDEGNAKLGVRLVVEGAVESGTVDL